MWSAKYDHVDGQALVTTRVAESCKDANFSAITYRAGGWSSLISSLGGYIKFWALVINTRPDVIYLVCSRSFLGFVRDIPILILAFSGYRVVAHAHGSDLKDLFRKKLIGPVARFLYKKCEIILPSTHLVSEVKRVGVSKVHVCENFHNTTVSRHFDEAKGTLHVLWNSNVIASKGVREVVQACELARGQGVDLHLTILGKVIGDHEASEEEMARWLSSIQESGWISVLGSVSRSKAQDFLTSSDVVALPSRYKSECQPLALIDAMSAALEIIIVDTPALRSTVGDYPAMVSGAAPSSICSALLKILEDRCMRQSLLQEAAQRSKVRFSPERFDSEIDAIFCDRSIDKNYSEGVE
ncbi:hypothetical protein CHH26_13070 [Qipengyuania flava]|nr:hypothetical protein CHH26_13070 [Qipengyuania flava]